MGARENKGDRGDKGGGRGEGEEGSERDRERGDNSERYYEDRKKANGIHS